MANVCAVTGPFSYTGKYIARRLIADGVDVRGLVRRPPYGMVADIDCRKLQFTDPDRLAADLEGSTVLYNTYWIRFSHGGETFADAVHNTAILANAAKRAGVGKIVHISVSNPSRDSPFAYFRGKAEAEDAVRVGVPVSIIRPTLVFGREDILVNNIAWLLRRLHVFPVPGSGAYRVQPVFVDDVAALALEQGSSPTEQVLDAAGPEIFTFKKFCELLARAVRTRALILPAPVWVALTGGRVLSWLLHDALITDEEIGALMAETLVSHQPPTAPTRLSDWLSSPGWSLGRTYTSEYKRHWSTYGS